MAGNHEEIAAGAVVQRWENAAQSPDLLDGAALSEEDKKLLAQITGEISQSRD